MTRLKRNMLETFNRRAGFSLTEAQHAMLTRMSQKLNMNMAEIIRKALADYAFRNAFEWPGDEE